MNYLRIVNNGLIEKEDLTLVGSSTKRGSKDKIGEFGSGNKFSLAWFERNNCTPKIFRGKDPLIIGHDIILHRDTPVKVITVNGEQTSITSTMGPKWTGWMALRETISNAMDEGGLEITTMINPEIKGEDNKTTYFIPMNEELSKVIVNYDKYFSNNRDVSFSNSKGEIFFKNDISELTVYRKGIRCWDTNKKFNYDLNLFDIDINESRLTNEMSFDRTMRLFIEEGISVEAMKRIILSKYYDMLPYDFSEHNLSVLQEIVNEGYKFGSDTMEKLAGMLGTTSFDFILPQRLINQLTRRGIIDENQNSKNDYIVVEDRPELSRLKYKLGVFNLSHVFTLKSVVTDSFNYIRIEDRTIYVNTDAHNSSNSDTALIYSIFNTIDRSLISELIEE
tara:strand:- start:2204 stop:3379 length:1176 start_codon:yes stop_codon:yes gene_type:complete